jgi:hypothetical protein
MVCVPEFAETNYDDGDEWTDDDAMESLMQDCGKGADGFCRLVGTEYCDWECPFS